MSRLPPRTRSTCALALVLLLAVAGCATRGASFQAEMIPNIQRGVTTQDQVQAWFGRPLGEQVWSGGGSRWSYLQEQEVRRDTGTLTKIARSVASILGSRVFLPPVDVEYKNVTRHELDLWFDEDGVVVDFRHERSEIPSKRVY